MILFFYITSYTPHILLLNRSAASRRSSDGQIVQPITWRDLSRRWNLPRLSVIACSHYPHGTNAIDVTHNHSYLSPSHSDSWVYVQA
jgi:hypothetical protein